MKISAEEYRYILENIALADIHLHSLHADLFEKNIRPNAQADFDIKERLSYSVNENLDIYYAYTLEIFDEETKMIILKIKAKYHIVYILHEPSIKISKSFMDIFRQMTVGMLLWPYFRQLVSDITSRMHLPPLTLPMKRVLNKNEK